MQIIASYQRAIAERISPIVASLIHRNPLFADLDPGETVGVVVPLIEDNFSPEEFADIAEERLTEKIKRVMEGEVLINLLRGLSPEQKAEVNAALSRSKRR